MQIISRRVNVAGYECDDSRRDVQERAGGGVNRVIRGKGQPLIRAVPHILPLAPSIVGHIAGIGDLERHERRASGQNGGREGRREGRRGGGGRRELRVHNAIARIRAVLYNLPSHRKLLSFAPSPRWVPW